MRHAITSSLLTLLALSGCDWVDSTGRQNNSSPVTEILLDDGSVFDAIALNEQSMARITATGSDEDGLVHSWSWSSQPQAEGALDVCVGVDGFDAQLAAASLQQACATGSDCSLDFEQSDSGPDGRVEFVLQAPELRASVGVIYALVATDNDGGQARSEHTFCLVSINEAPAAVDDSFTVSEGNQLVVTADSVNLLSNDSDDLDVSNQALRVLTRARQPPASASVFELRSDGGFTYAFSGTNLVDDIVDSFEYEITDGLFTSSATVTLRIVAQDDPPELIASIPQLIAIAGIEFSDDLSVLFADPEDGSLSFDIVAGDFPEPSGLVLDIDGLLHGIASNSDIGDYLFTVSAADSGFSVVADIPLQIVGNALVVVDPIPLQHALVGERVSFSIGPFFSDPELQPLSYAIDSDEGDADDSAVSLTINPRTGVVSGFLLDAGDYELVVSASDGFSEPTTALVEIIVDEPNSAPEFSGLIQNQSVLLGRRISTIRADFVDPDGDELGFTLVGTLPIGLVLSGSGVLSGRPIQVGRFDGLRIVATDTSGLSTSSNAFTLTIGTAATTANSE